MKVGDKVRFTNRTKHRDYPDYFPRAGTVGTVIDFPENYNGDIRICVQWPLGSTAYKSRWWCDVDDVELVEEDKE